MIHTEGLTRQIQPPQVSTDIDHESQGLFITEDAREGLVLLQFGVRILPKLVVEIELGVRIEAEKITRLQREPQNLVRCRQTIVEDDFPLVQPVLDVPRRSCHR